MIISNKIYSVLQRDLILALTNICTGVIIARVLGVQSLGIWMILSLVPSYAEAIGRTKSDVAAIFFMGKKKFSPEDVIVNLNIIGFTSSIILLTIIIINIDILYSFLFNNTEYIYIYELKLILAQIPLNFIYLNYSYIHIAIGNINVHNRMTAINSLVSSIITISLLNLTNLGIWSVIIGIEVAILVSTIYGIRQLKLSTLGRGKYSLNIIKSLISYGFNFYIAGIFSQLNETGTRLISLVNLLPSEIAFLGQGQMSSQLLNKFPAAMNLILFPHISQSENNDAIYISLKAFRILSILMVSTGIMLYIFCKPLIELVYGPNFEPVAIVLYYIIPGVVFSGLAGIFANYFNGTGNAKLIPRLQILSVLTQLTLAYIFLKWWGFIGAAIAISIGLSIYGLAVIMMFIKYTNTPYALLIPSSNDFLILKIFLLRKLNIK